MYCIGPTSNKCNIWTRTGSKNRTHTRETYMKLLYFNARSVKSVNRNRNKIVQLRNLVDIENTNILIITKIWLPSTISDSEVLPSGYTVYRKNRENNGTDKEGGGVLIGINWALCSLRRTDLKGHSEILACGLRPHQHSKIAFVACYRPPSSNIDVFSANFEAIMAKVTKEFKYICLLGDLLFHPYTGKHSEVAVKVNKLSLKSLMLILVYNYIAFHP